MVPSKSSRCLVFVPYYKQELTALERFCLEKSIDTLRESFDIVLACPIGIKPPSYSGCTTIAFSANHFADVSSYCRWLLEPEIYQFSLLYDYMLILQLDAIVFKNDLNKWCSMGFDFVGAPWSGRVSFSYRFKSRPNLNAEVTRLDVGNGGLCLINPRSFLGLQRLYPDVFLEWYTLTGPNAGQEALYCFLGERTPFFKMPTKEQASLFSLELDARNWININNELPLGFHAMFKYDADLWRELFPSSPSL